MTTVAAEATGWTLIVGERTRQITEEQHTTARDDTYVRGELRAAARAYITATDLRPCPPQCWPWPREAWKPRDRVVEDLPVARVWDERVEDAAAVGEIGTVVIAAEPTSYGRWVVVVGTSGRQVAVKYDERKHARLRCARYREHACGALS